MERECAPECGRLQPFSNRVLEDLPAAVEISGIDRFEGLAQPLDPGSRFLCFYAAAAYLNLGVH